MEGHKGAKGNKQKRISRDTRLVKKQNTCTKSHKTNGFFAQIRATFSDDTFARKAQTIGAYSAAFMAAFLVALVSASAFTPLDNTEASDTIGATLNGSGYNITITTTGTSSEGQQVPGVVSMDITPTSDGAVAVAKDTVNVVTNSKSYKVYVSMARGNDNSRLNLDGSASATAYFGPVAGTTSAPIELTNNTWGWALAGNTIDGYAFDTVYTMSNGAASDGTTGHSLNTSQKFAAMPASGSEALIATGTAATTGTDYDVYYGARATTALMSGTYSGTVVYTAIGEASSAAKGEAAISPEIQTTLDPDTSETQGAGQQVIISTSMYMSSALAIGNVTATIGGKACTNATPSIDPAAGTINVTCNAPESLTWGDYNVEVVFPKFDKSYSIAKGYSVYIPFSTVEQAEPGTYPMQAFTSRSCSEAPTPKAYTTTSGEGSVLNGDTVNTDVPEVTLKDARDNKTYRVRKLADGSCWMAENLRYVLSKNTPLTSEDSDIEYNMDTGVGLDRKSTIPRVVSNPLEGSYEADNGKNVYKSLGQYHTDSSGVISWTPYTNSQTTFDITWGSPCANDTCTEYVTQDYGEGSSANYFEPGSNDSSTLPNSGSTGNGRISNSKYVEYARSYDNEGNGQSGTGHSSTNLKLIDGDEKEQYYGTYYNWYSVTAGSGTWERPANDRAPNSVCPRNWHLPKYADGGTWYDFDGSWFDLFRTTYGFTAEAYETGVSVENATAQKSPFSLVLSGYYNWNAGGLTGRGYEGDYQTSYGATERTHMRDFITRNPVSSTTAFYIGGRDYKAFGFTARCVIH